VTAEWETSAGQRGSGKARPLTDESGTFWFFAESNVEIIVKVLDACGAFGRFWVFAAGLTRPPVPSAPILIRQASPSSGFRRRTPSKRP